VTWVYHLADKTTKVNVDTVHGSDTFPQIIKSVGQHLFVNCTPKDANTYCKDASATIAPSSSGSNYSIKGSASASVGPLAP
jgi:hypothetical protein